MIGETLRCIRIANENMKVKEAAKKIGVSSPFISEIERNVKGPSLRTLTKLSKLYNIPLSKIMELDEYNDTCTDLSFQRTLIKILEYYIASNGCKKDNSKVENPNQFVKIMK